MSHSTALYSTAGPYRVMWFSCSLHALHRVVRRCVDRRNLPEGCSVRGNFYREQLTFKLAVRAIQRKLAFAFRRMPLQAAAAAARYDQIVDGHIVTFECVRLNA